MRPNQMRDVMHNGYTARRIWNAALGLLVLAAMMCAMLFAGRETYADGEKATVTVDVKSVISYTAGMEIGLYRVGSRVGAGFEADPGFEKELTDFFAKLNEQPETLPAAEPVLKALENKPMPASSDGGWIKAAVSEGKAVFTVDRYGVYYGTVLSGPESVVTQSFFVDTTYSDTVEVKPKTQLVTSAEVHKTWDDAENQDGVRPGSLTVTLYQYTYTETPPAEPAGQAYVPSGADEPYTAVLNEGNGWTARIGNLPREAESGKYGYYWRETAAPSGYENTANTDTAADYSDASKAGVWKSDLTNTHSPEKTSIPVKKIWDDANDQDRKRPSSVTVHLQKNGTTLTGDEYTLVLNADNQWKGELGNLDKYENGSVITYTWIEDVPEPYSVSYSSDTTEITNHYTPETTNASVRKVWEDADNQDGFRPDSITVTLYRKVGSGEEEAMEGDDYTKELNEDNKWSAEITGLPKKKDGADISYWWKETAVPEHYELTQETTEATVTTLTNTHEPETVEFTVNKHWVGDAGAERPKSIKAVLHGVGDETFTYELTADDAVASDAWQIKTGKLPKCRSGQEIKYFWEEVYVNGYITEVVRESETSSVVNITNTYIPLVDVSVQKTWIDENNADQVRPSDIKVQLYQGLGDDGQTDRIKYGAAVTLKGDETVPWSYTWANLPSMNDQKQTYVYTVEEEAVPGYTTEIISNNKYSFIITNTHEVPKGALRITKQVTVNGNPTESTAADGDYFFHVTGPKERSDLATDFYGSIAIRNGSAVQPINLISLYPGTYTVEEITNGYTSEDGRVTIPALPENIKPNVASREVTVTAGTTAETAVTADFTNNMVPTPTPTSTPTPTPTYAPPPDGGGGPTPTPVPDTPTTEVSVNKVWNDENNAHRTRPESVTLHLYADGTEVNSTTLTGSGNIWTYTFTNLPQENSSGETITYTVSEDNVPGYRSTISGTTVTNTLIPQTPQNYTSINGTKIWADNADAEGLRPAYITVNLLRNGTVIDSRTVNAGNGWSYSFQNLPTDDGYGNDYTYAVREGAVTGYYQTLSGWNLTNSLLPPQRGNVPPPGRTTRIPPFEEHTEEELEDLLDLFDYGTPLWGGLLGTGDDLPAYPFVFGGIGVAAVLVLLIFGRRRKKGA